MTQTIRLSCQPRQSNHGHKRKGKPVEAWMLELEKAQDEENGSNNLDLSTIEQIADGVEQMVFSWGLNKQERGHEYAKLSKSLSKENNSHVLLPWSLNIKSDKLGQIHSTIESNLTTKNKTLETSMQSPTTLRTKCESPKHTMLRRKKDFDNDRDISETTLENLQFMKLEEPLQSCDRVLTSLHSIQNCIGRDELHECENRAQDGSTCLAMAIEQESQSESTRLEIKKDNCMSNNICILGSTNFSELSKKGLNDKEVEHQCNTFCTWTLETTIPRNNQQFMLRHQNPPPILTRNGLPPFLSQSPLCIDTPSESPRQETTQSSEVNSNEHGGLCTSLTNLPLCSPIYENEQEDGAPLLPILDARPCCEEDIESVEVGGHTIKVTTLKGSNDILEHKFQALVNINACTLGIQEEHQLKPSPTSDVEDLQIALLECAMEYEIKTIEAKMKMQELKLRGQHSNVAFATSKQSFLPQRVIEPLPSCEKAMDNQRLQQLKKQMHKLQHEKDTVNNELHSFREKERKFERQKRSLEDALLRVNRLQREVVKKEQEVVEWQLKEKETKAQLQEVGEKLNRERHAQVLLPLEPKKLLTLLPALREWLRSLKKMGLTKPGEHRQFQDKEEGDIAYPYMTHAYNHVQPLALHGRDKGMPIVIPAHLSMLRQLTEELANQSNPMLNIHQVDMVICCLTKEIHALQKELSKLAKS